MASDAEFRFILHRFPINVIGLDGLHFFFIAWPDVRECCTSCWLQQRYTAVHSCIALLQIAQSVQDRMETQQQSHQLSGRFAAAGSQPAPVPAERQVLVKYAM